MSEDFLKDPLSLFSVKGKTAIVTGASGAFGALAAKVLAGAGANVVICASNAAELKKVAAECEALGGGKVEIVAKRPSSEANCDTIVNAAVDRFGSVDILVVASGQNKVSKIVDQKADDFLDVMDANVTQSWLMARAAGRQMLKQGKGGKVILMSSARGLLGHPAGYTRLLRLEVGGRRHHQGARLRVGRHRHHRQCARPDRLPLAADRMDVRRRRARQDHARRLPHARAERPAGRARPISPGRCCSSPPRRRTSTPATSSTPTAATRRVYEATVACRACERSNSRCDSRASLKRG